MLSWIEPLLGAAIMLIALLDLFLTVLYARVGAGFISDRVARANWSFYHWLSKAFGRSRATVLSLAGSAIVVSLVATWAVILTVGSALIMHQYLGTSVKGSDDDTSRDFLTALYAGGSSMSLVGASDYNAKTTAFRMVFLFNSLVGMSVMSLALTYVMQVYNALQTRNTFGLGIEQMSAASGDAAVLIQGLGPNGKFEVGYSNIGSMADAVTSIREAQDFYPVLFYFRYPEARYSASRTSLISLDTVSLLRAAIPDGANGWVKRAASVSQLWEASLSLLTTLQCAFLPEDKPRQPTPHDRDRWRRRYSNAAAALREAGIETVPDTRGGRYLRRAPRTMEWLRRGRGPLHGLGHERDRPGHAGVIAACRVWSNTP